MTYKCKYSTHCKFYKYEGILCTLAPSLCKLLTPSLFERAERLKEREERYSQETKNGYAPLTAKGDVKTENKPLDTSYSCHVAHRCASHSEHCNKPEYRDNCPNLEDFYNEGF